MYRHIKEQNHPLRCRDKDTQRTEKRSDVSRTEQEKTAGLNEEDKLRHRIGSLSYMRSRAGHNREHSVVVNEAKTELCRSRVVWTGGIKVLRIPLHHSWLAFLHVLVQPLKTFEQSFTRRGTTRVDIPRAIPHAVET